MAGISPHQSGHFEASIDLTPSYKILAAIAQLAIDELPENHFNSSTVYPLGSHHHNSLYHLLLAINLHALVLLELDFNLTET